MKSKPTILDVAKHAGVSKVTVSYVLSGQGATARISSSTEKRVRESAATLNYRPNAVARTLATRRSDTIGVLFQHAQYFSSRTSFIEEVVRGVADGALHQDFDLLMHTRRPSTAEEEIHALADGRVDGILALRDSPDPTVQGLIDSRVPTVFFFTRSDYENVPYVDVDNFKGGNLAAEHLFGLGHRRIGMVEGALKSTSASERSAGFLSYLQEAGLNVKNEHRIMLSEPGQGVEAFAEILKMKNRPTAFFIWSDDVAFHCMKVATDLGIKIPDELSIIGFDACAKGETSVPPLTSVKQPIIEIAMEATRILARLINGKEIPSKSTLFEPSLTVRHSTATPPPLKSKEL